MLDENSVPVLHPQVAARAVDGQMLIVLADRGEVMVLNDTGTQLWTWLDGTRCIRELGNVLAATYGLEARRAQADTRDFLQSLWEIQAIELVDGTG
jgi:hypothetical protein